MQNHNINQKIQALNNSDSLSLKSQWEEYFGRPPPSKIGKVFMVRAIAYQIQLEQNGSLKSDTQFLLNKYSEQLKISGKITSINTPQIKPGTRLLRTWKATHYEVIVLPDNQFMWHGRAYSSLSKIAREITGTRRNGPEFFGLRS